MPDYLTKIERAFYRVEKLGPRWGPYRGRCPQCDAPIDGARQIDVYQSVRRHERLVHGAESEIEGPIGRPK